MSLKGKSAVVTGSTSGIGLGIARALAAEGADIMLNGFGDAQEIEEIRAGLETEFGIKAAFDGADIICAPGHIVGDAWVKMGMVDEPQVRVSGHLPLDPLDPVHGLGEFLGLGLVL